MPRLTAQVSQCSHAKTTAKQLAEMVTPSHFRWVPQTTDGIGLLQRFFRCLEIKRGDDIRHMPLGLGIQLLNLLNA